MVHTKLEVIALANHLVQYLGKKDEGLATERESPIKRKARLDGSYGRSMASYLNIPVRGLEEM